MIYWEESWNETPSNRQRRKTISELHDAMIRWKEQDFDDEPFDPVESELDVYNL